MTKVYTLEEMSNLPAKWLDVEHSLPPLSVEVQVYRPYILTGQPHVTALTRYPNFDDSEYFHWDSTGHSNIHRPETITLWQPMAFVPKINFKGGDICLTQQSL